MTFEVLFRVGLEVVWKIGPIPCLESCEIYYPGWDSGRGSANKNGKVIIRLTQSSWTGTGTELGNISRTEVDLGKKGYSTVFFVPPQLIFFWKALYRWFLYWYNCVSLGVTWHLKYCLGLGWRWNGKLLCDATIGNTPPQHKLQLQWWSHLSNQH